VKLSELKPNKGAIKTKKRLGRGPGSGWGTTGGKGYNGDRARTGGGVRAGFAGGQMPIVRALPKRGFFNLFRVGYQVVNLGDIDKRVSGQTTLDPEKLESLGLVNHTRLPIKILGEGQISFPVTIKAHAFSASAMEKIQKANGKAEVISKYTKKAPTT